MFAKRVLHSVSLRSASIDRLAMPMVACINNPIDHCEIAVPIEKLRSTLDQKC